MEEGAKGRMPNVNLTADTDAKRSSSSSSSKAICIITRNDAMAKEQIETEGERDRKEGKESVRGDRVRHRDCQM